MDSKKEFKILGRYILILLVSLGNLFLFYKIFTLPTLYFSYWILSLFRETVLVNNIIIFGDSLLEIVKACVAGAAYFLLFILAMSIPLETKKRIKLILFSFMSLFFINILRIVIMAFLADSFLFESLHMLIWNFFSTIFVVGVWFLSVRVFKIKEIPFYTDFMSIKSSIKKPKKKSPVKKSKNSKTRKKN